MRWIGVALLPILMAGACDREAPPRGELLPAGDKTECPCPEMIDIRVTKDAMWVAGNAILKTDEGRIDAGLVDEKDNTIIPLRNLLAKFQEIEARGDFGHSCVLVLVDDPIPEQSMAVLKSTLDQLGFGYRIRTYRS